MVIGQAPHKGYYCVCKKGARINCISERFPKFPEVWLSSTVLFRASALGVLGNT